MKISNYLIQELVPYVTGDGFAPRRSGPDLVKLFNKYGARDVYDDVGLPDIGKRNGHRPARKEYVEARLKDMSGKPEFRELLTEVINNMENAVDKIQGLNKLLIPEKYSVVVMGGKFAVQGGIVHNRKPIINQAHFEDIQNKLLTALNDAKVSIRVVVAWFTNQVLFDKLVEKHREGVDVEIAIYDDGINRKHGVNIIQLPHKLIKKGKRGGLMHDKFCIVDNQIAITGSYNWTNNAEFKNDENITVEHDPEQATKFSIEYRKLTT